MPVSYTITPDINDGTMLSVGVALLNPERAVRRHLVEATGGTGTKYGAISAVNSTYSTHPDISGMPLQNTVGVQIGVNKWWIDQVFGWSSTGHWGGSSVTTVCDYELGMEGVPCFTVGEPESDGLPSVTISGSTVWFNLMATNFRASPPQSYTFYRPVLRIRIPVRSNTNPVTATIAGLINKINDDSVTFLASNASPLTFAAGKVRFDGARVQARANASYIFQGSLDFTAAASFNVMNAKFTSGAWAATKTECLARADFNTAFGI